MREPRGEEFDDAVRRRLRAVWPTAEPLPDEDVERWRRRDIDAEDSAVPPVRPAGRSALGSFDPGRRGVRALAVVAAVVVLVAGYLAWRASPHAEPVPAATVAASLNPLDPTGPGGPSSLGGSIVVAVTGRVRHPGLVRLPAGARVQDAIEAAGGVLPGTDMSFVNLARRLTDGELLIVGITPPPGVVPGGAAAGGTAAGKVNLNTASLAELDGLPGIGPALAQRIIDYRNAHGGFRSITELSQVPGIGDAKFAQLKDRVTV